jgi:hypothetical protein
VGLLGGTRYGTYLANLTYDMCMLVLDVQTWPRADVPCLGLTDGDVGLFRGVDCDILAQDFNRIDRILIPPSNTFFSESTPAKTLGLSVLSLEQFQDG